MNASISFSRNEIEIFRGMIGKQFDMFKCDPFVYSPMVYGMVGLYIDGVAYKLTSLCESVNRFYNIDDVATLHINQASDAEIQSFMDKSELLENPISSKIVSIDIVTDHQTVENDEKSESLDYTVGVIFHFEDAREVSFEIKTWFSEMITVEKGYNLIEKFSTTNSFLEEWEDCEGYNAKSVREILTIV